MPISYDPELEISEDLIVTRGVEDISLAGKEAKINQRHAEIEKAFGRCALRKHTFVSSGLRHSMQDKHDVVIEQDAYAATLGPVVHPELTGAAAEKEASKAARDVFLTL